MRFFGLLVVLCLAVSAQESCSDEESYSEMVTETDDCGETTFEDACGTQYNLKAVEVGQDQYEDTQILEEELGAPCGNGAPGSFSFGAQRPSPPVVSATAGCDKDIKATWSAPYDGGAEVVEYKITVYKDGAVFREFAKNAADVPKLASGDLYYYESELQVAKYKIMVQAGNKVGLGMAAASLEIMIPESYTPSKPTSVNTYGTKGKVHVTIFAATDRVCSQATGYTIKAFLGETVVAVVKSTTTDFVFTTANTATGDMHDAILVNGNNYTFTAAAYNDKGESFFTDRSIMVTARDAPTQPLIDPCLEGGFQCYVQNNCSGDVSLSWPASTPQGPPTDAIFYKVRAFIGTELVHAHEFQTNSPAFAKSSLDWAIGKVVRFSFAAVNGEMGYTSGWTDTSGVLIPGPPTLPTATMAFAPGLDSVTASWTSADARWIGDDTAIKQFRLVATSNQGEARATICMAKDYIKCFAKEWPAECANAQCTSTYTFTQPAVRHNQWDKMGIKFSIEAEAKYHSNCAATGVVTTGVFPIGAPVPPKNVKVHLPSLSMAGSLICSWDASNAFSAYPTTGYVAKLYTVAGALQSTASVVSGLNKPEFSHLFPGLAAEQSYYCTVQASNSKGRGFASLQSASMQPKPVPYSGVQAAVFIPGVSAAGMHGEAKTAALIRAIANASACTVEQVVIISMIDIAATGTQAPTAAASSGRGSGRRLTVAGVDAVFETQFRWDEFGGEAAANARARNARLTFTERQDEFVAAVSRNMQAENIIVASNSADVAFEDAQLKSVTLTSTPTAKPSLEGDKIAGMSSYGFWVMMCGVATVLLGAFFAVFTRNATMALPSAPKPKPSKPSTPRGDGSRDVELTNVPGGGGWKRASIKAPNQTPGTETSFFEADFGEDDGDFVNPALAESTDDIQSTSIHRASVSGAASADSARKASASTRKPSADDGAVRPGHEAERRDSLRKGSAPFLSTSSKKNMQRKRGLKKKTAGALDDNDEEEGKTERKTSKTMLDSPDATLSALHCEQTEPETEEEEKRQADAL
jgi:hypothetical protein